MTFDADPMPSNARKRTVLLMWTLAAAGLSAGVAQTPASVRSVWDGVYTAAQADRGKVAYDATCASCHHEDLSGASARPLVGDRFWQDWGEDTLFSLYATTKATMPRDGAGALSDETYLDITAYILKANGYPAGSSDLTSRNITGVRVIRREGPGPVPDFALVSVVGCLTPTPGGAWSLTNSTTPTRNRNPDQSKGDDLQRVRAMPLGSHTFDLMDVYAAGKGHEGHKMEVKGFLLRGRVDRVNITSMQMLSAECQ